MIAKAELISVEGGKLGFWVEAHDEVEKIGEDLHTRAIIDIERFKTKLGGGISYLNFI